MTGGLICNIDGDCPICEARMQVSGWRRPECACVPARSVEQPWVLLGLHPRRLDHLPVRVQTQDPKADRATYCSSHAWRNGDVACVSFCVKLSRSNESFWRVLCRVVTALLCNKSCNCLVLSGDCAWPILSLATPEAQKRPRGPFSGIAKT